MAISHVCLNCGRDLARVRASLDPAYRLPLVHCPTCPSVWVRRREPMAARFGAGRRVVRAGGALVLQLAAAWIILLVLAGSIAGVAHAMSEARLGFVGAAHALWEGTPAMGAPRTDLHGDRGFVLAAGVIGASIIAGAWLTATLRHARPWRVALFWPVVLVLAVSMDVLFWLPVGGARILAGDQLFYNGPGFSEWLTRVGLLAPAAVFMGIGIVAGLGVRRVEDQRRRRALVRLLRRRRRARRGA